MKPYIVIILSLFFPEMYSQSVQSDVLASSGGSGSMANVTLCWTLGETIINEISVPGFTLSQGFHQYQLTLISDLEDLPGETRILAYPNPVGLSLTINITSPLDRDHWHIDIFDYRGVIVIQKQADQGSSILDFTSLASGAYVVRISDQDDYKVFNIIKQ